MASEVSTIQSLKAVDAWIDVINANINGGVRTAFKASRLKFSGSNTTVDRAGNATSLPLQFPEPGLTTANTVIDFSQGAITTSTENTHLAIQGDGFFLLASPDMIDPDQVTGGDTQGGDTRYSAAAKLVITRDSEFHTNQYGYLVHSSGFYLVLPDISGGIPVYSSTNIEGNSLIRPIINDIDNPSVSPTIENRRSVRLSDFLTGSVSRILNGTAFGAFPARASLIQVPLGQQTLLFSNMGSTVFDIGFKVSGGAANGTIHPSITLVQSVAQQGSILSKSLEASNASMTQSVPELSLAQKLFSALTKVLQTQQTNLDNVLNTVR